VLRGHLLCAAMEITLNAETWTVGGHKGLSAGAGGTGQAVTFDDSQLWGVRYFDAAHSLLDTQDLIVSHTHNRVSMHDDNQSAPSSDAPPHPHPHPHFAPLPVPMPLPLWRMHPLHRLGSVPSKDVSLRLIDPITINVSTEQNIERVCTCSYFICNDSRSTGMRNTTQPCLLLTTLKHALCILFFTVL
jgi:hypothetical protein